VGELTGQKFDEYQGFGWAKAVHPEDQLRSVEEWNRCVRYHLPFLWEHRVRRRDGVYRTFAVPRCACARRDTVREWVGIHTDVTEQRANESALRAAAERGAVLSRLNTVLRSSFDPDESSMHR
jgi:PAS domain-containing protein